MRGPLFLFLTVGLACGVQAADDVKYQGAIKPLFAEKCSACHGALKQEAGLRLDAGVLIRKGSEDGPVIVPGKAERSLLIRKVTAADPAERMPPEGAGAPLNAQQVALLSAWINGGAVVPEDEEIPTDPRDHWAYQVPQRPPVPDVIDPQWSHPIDAFIADKHRQHGLTAVGQADRYTLLRRAYLDLIGLPPTRGQLQTYIEDESPDAWHKVVDALLESPHYGERWGRHWMDVWRYSDWDGYKDELRGSQRHIWRWRDWIIASLNADKGYDRMIVEMLAGDEIAPNDAAVLPATGFLARNYHKSNRDIWLDATVEHTAKAFLGLTLNCARCHDHKYDPIPQTDYYRFRAIFEAHQVRTDRIPGQPDIMQDGLPRAFDADLNAQTYLFRQGNDKRPDKDHPLTPAVPAVLGGDFDIQPVSLPLDAYYPALREFVVNDRFAAAQKRLAEVEKLLSAATADESNNSEDQTPGDNRLLEMKRTAARLELQSLAARHAADRAKYAEADDDKATTLAAAAVKIELEWNVQKAQLEVEEKQAALRAAESGDENDQQKNQKSLSKVQQELDEAQKKLETAQEAQKKNDGEYSPLGTEYPRTSSGRRLALARWIVANDNPLTARVAVNHIWLRHFGRPLVDNVFDFGLRAARPRHADLLDWLSVEFREHNWSMKHLHRLIVTSRTWRLQSSAVDSARTNNRSIDPDNNYLWRMNVHRLDAEIIRDRVLAVSGELDTAVGGADIDFHQGETSPRRSIYLQHAYEKQMTMLVLFDAASPNECYRRSASIVPQQALALSNSSMSLGHSRMLARRLWREVSADGDDPQSAFLRSAFLQVLSRPPSDQELAACLQFLTEQTATLTDTSKLTTFAGGVAPKVDPATNPFQRALENLVHVLMNHNDFVTVR